MPDDRLPEGFVLNNRYSIIEIVGKGGMGTVYKAKDNRLEVIVAVKEMIEKDVTPDERTMAVRQFEREAKLLGQLHHPNLPRVTDYFVEDDHCYLIMEFVVGTTLETKLKDAGSNPLPILDVLDWAVELSDALTYLHTQDPPIVFRDLKPANIMLMTGNIVKLIDFGIARRFNSGATKDTLLYGSPGYSPPEQYGRAQTDPRSDIYALGATLHHLLTGRDPSPTPFRFPPARQINPNLTQSIEVVLTRCLEMDLDKRIQSAEELRGALLLIRAEVASLPSKPISPINNDNSLTNDVPPTPVVKITGPKVRSSPAKPSASYQGEANRSGLMWAGFGLVAIIILAIALMRSPKKSNTEAKVSNAPSTESVTSGNAVSKNDGARVTDATAKLRISSNPSGAVVYVDGKQYGTTPVEVANLAGGQHTVRLVPPTSSGLVEHTKQVDLNTGSTKDIEIDLKSANNGDTPSVAGTPAAAFSAMEAIENGDKSGVTVRLSFKISAASGKPAVAAVFFYSADGSTPLKPKAETSTYGNIDGNMSVSKQVNIDNDPADFAISLPVPYSVFPVDSPNKVAYRAFVFVDSKVIAQTDIKPLAR